MKIKRVLSFILLAAMLVGCVALAASCGGDKTPPACTTHTDANEDLKCDVCGAELEPEEEPCDEHMDTDDDNHCDLCDAIMFLPVDVSVTIKSENGQPITDVTVELHKTRGEITTSKTDASGVAKFELLPGEYTFRVEGVPDGWYVEGTGKKLDVSDDNKAFSFVAVDNNPDGSEEKPYYVGTDVVEKTFKNGETFNYFTKGSGKYLIITNKNAKVIYDGDEYLPDENGKLRVYIKAAADTNSQTNFKVMNIASGENKIAVEFEILPGASEKPIEATSGKLIAVEIEGEISMFYKWVATESGYMILVSDTVDNNIMMHNLTSYEVTRYTDGGKVLYLAVTKGDEVMINVGSKSETKSTVEFEIAVAGGNEANPLEFNSAFNFRIKSGKTVCFKYTGDANALTVNASGVKLAINGVEQTAVAGVYTLNVSKNDIITIVAGSSNADISITE